MRVRTGAGQSRRRFLFGASLAVLSTTPIGAALTASIPPAAARQRGSARAAVRDFGARGDGVHDDTKAFQAAIDSLSADGGTVHVPAGTYSLDPVRCVRLRDRMHLEMATDARLVARPNALERAYVLSVEQVDDVEISGGRIVGDRDTHLGTTGEWGHGVMIRGASRITVRNLHVSKCWGDGISIGGAKAAGGQVVPSIDVVVADVVCDGNRRQGLTIGRSRQVRVRDSTFANTGGTLPGCGIDVEPDAGDIARDVRIEDCLVRGNQGAGIQLYHRAGDVTIRGCTIEGNRGDGVLLVGAGDCVISGNLIRYNDLAGVRLGRGSRDVLVDDNHFGDNRRQARRTGAVSAKARLKHVTLATGTEAIRVTGNQFDD